MITFCRNILFIIALLASTPVFADALIENSIDSLQIFVGDQTGMHLSALVKPGQKVRFPDYRPQQMITAGVEIVEAPRIDTTEESDGYIKVTQHLLLTSFEDSLYCIPVQKVMVDGKAQMSKTLALKVLTVEVDTLHPNQFFGAKDVQDNPFLWEEWAEVFWISVLAMIMYVICWLAYLRLKSDKPIQLKVRIVKRIPPHQRALTAIDKIKSTAQTSDPKTYYTELTETLRRYMEERFGFSAMEMTSSEIIARLKQEGDDEKIQELRMLFETADLVKFAKYDVNFSENDRNLVSAVEFINTTKQDNLPTEERIEPTITEQQRQTIRMRLSLKWTMAVLVILASIIIGYVLYQVYDIMC